MKFSKGKLGVLALVGVLFLSGCSKVDDGLVTNEDPTQNPAAGINLKLDESTARAKKFDELIEGIKSITLKDVEGNIVDQSFNDEEVTAIETAFNDSFIMDTAYIEMITGYNMTISLENGEEVFITSYGDPVYIVARVGEGNTYHLYCEAIATILLEGMN